MSCPFAEWGIAEATREGERVSGDRPVLRRGESGLMVACVDGVGHGVEAARAADAAARVLEAGLGAPLGPLLARCHRQLRGTRGAVLFAAWFDLRTYGLTWAGVGEVHGVLLRAELGALPPRRVLVAKPGVVGRGAPVDRTFRLAVDPGDVLVIATDGVREEFMEDLAPPWEPSVLARNLMVRHHRREDDALIVAVRFRRPGE